MVLGRDHVCPRESYSSAALEKVANYLWSNKVPLDEELSPCDGHRTLTSPSQRERCPILDDVHSVHKELHWAQTELSLTWDDAGVFCLPTDKALHPQSLREKEIQRHTPG